MAKKRKYTASVIVSLPAGEYDASGYRDALDKLMRTEFFGKIRTQTQLSEIKVLVVGQGDEIGSGAIFTIPKVSPRKKKEIKQP